jgi:drug/metabolite transporter (DMT)-like permease
MVFFWALSFPVSKIALRDFPALLLPGLRVTLAAVLLSIYYFSRHRAPKLDWFEIGQFAMLGFLGVAINQQLFLSGVQRTSVAHASIVIALTPVQVLTLSGLLGRERVTMRKLIGMVIALGGVVALQLTPGRAGEASLAGDLLILAAGFTFALFTVFGRPTSQRFGTMTTTTFVYIASALWLLPLTVWRSIGFNFAGVSWTGWACFLFMTLFPSILSYLIYYYALSRIPASRVSAFSYLQPVFATLLAIPLLGEMAGWPAAAGGALVLTGVAIAERG